MKTTIKALRTLVKEEVEGAESDPFASPPSIKDVWTETTDLQKRLRKLPETIDRLASTNRSLKSRNDLKKAVGLVHHASQDLKAIEAILMVLQQQIMRRN